MDDSELQEQVEYLTKMIEELLDQLYAKDEEIVENYRVIAMLRRNSLRDIKQ